MKDPAALQQTTTVRVPLSMLEMTPTYFFPDMDKSFGSLLFVVFIHVV
jgi:hypothetical protein